MAYESKIFYIDPAIEKRIHPEAFKVLTNWEKFDLLMLQAELTAADIDEHLEDNEKAKFQRCMNQIWEGLESCMDVGDGVTLYDVYIGDIFLKKGIISQFQRTSLLPLCSIKLLLEKAWRQKLEKGKQEAEQAREEKRREEEKERQEAAKAEEERRKKEEKAEAQRKKKESEQKWHEGFKVLGEDLWDAAEHYLDKRECDKFRNAVIEAIELHVKTGGKYEEWELPFEYRWYRDNIKSKKAKEQVKVDAENQAARFNQGLNHFTEKLKASLSSKQNTAKYFNKDIRLPTGDLYECLSPEQQDKLMDIVRKVAEPRLQQLIPEAYRDFVPWENFHYYRFHPVADYVFDGVPCLAFSFEVEAVVESEIQLIPGQRAFRGYLFNIHAVITSEGCRTALQKPKLLGYLYQHLSLVELPLMFWQTIPLNLLEGLMHGEIVPQGTKVIEASEVEITYEVKGFDDLVTIPAVFRAWLGEMQGFEGMVTAGVISNQTARIIIEQTPELKSAPIEETAATEQPTGFTKEEFIEKLTGLGYPEAHAELLSKKIPEGLDLDEAVRWALREYQRIIAENPTSGSY